MISFSSIFRNRVFIFFSYFFVSLFIFLIWIRGADSENTSFTGDPGSRLSALISGTAERPFVERALIPFLTNTVLKVLPGNPEEEVDRLIPGNSKLREEISRLQWEEDFIPEYLIALFFSFIALYSFSFVIRSLFKTFYETDGNIISLIPVFSLIFLPPFFLVGTHYIYDFPALLFFNLAFLLLIQKRWPWFFLVYFTGSINKETMVFLIPIYLLLYFDKSEKRNLVLNSSLMLLISLGVKLALGWIFTGNDGSPVRFYLYKNLDLLLKPYSFSFLLIFISIFALVFIDFKNKPLPLTKALWVIIPYGIIFFIFGIIVEIRSLYEIFPLIFLLSLHTILFTFFKVPYKLKNF